MTDHVTRSADDLDLAPGDQPEGSGRSQSIPKGPGRVLDVLTAVTASRRPVSGGEVATRLGIPRSTTSLLLRALIEREAISIDPRSGMYVPGPLLFRLGYALSGNAGPVRLARPILERLAAESGEDVYMGVRSGLSIMYLDKVEGSQALHLAIELGVGRPLHCTAMGKVFLAEDETLLDQILAKGPLEAKTAKTITDPGKLRRALDRVRRDGYATSAGENVEGIMSLAAPVRNSDGQAIAGISISCVVARGKRMEDPYSEMLRRSASEIDILLRLPGEPGLDS